MAKQQNLSLNPVKISGLCGRLMCCLRFESESYDDTTVKYPDIGDRVITPAGEGTVIAVYKPKGSIRVQMDETKDVVEFPAEEVAEAES